MSVFARQYFRKIRRSDNQLQEGRSRCKKGNQVKMSSLAISPSSPLRPRAPSPSSPLPLKPLDPSPLSPSPFRCPFPCDLPSSSIYPFDAPLSPLSISPSPSPQLFRSFPSRPPSPPPHDDALQLPYLSGISRCESRSVQHDASSRFNWLSCIVFLFFPCPFCYFILITPLLIRRLVSYSYIISYNFHFLPSRSCCDMSLKQ